jgi:hypothetical protein
VPKIIFYIKIIFSGQMSECDIQLELDRIFQTLQLLKERGTSIDNGTTGNGPRTGAVLANKIAAIQEAIQDGKIKVPVMPLPNTNKNTTAMAAQNTIGKY